MNKWGKRSLEIRETIHPKLQLIVDKVLEKIDITLISGHRDKLEQNILFKEGKSKLKYPMSKHNSNPSTAVDLAKWNKTKPRIRWEDRGQALFIAGYVQAVADQLGIKIRLGADWNGDQIFDESFFDPWHIELDKSEV
jgi:peptidoglycan L-alanyl-D-glutamate endopeptidase CwlK